MSKAEQNYAIMDKDRLALIFAIKHFRLYLHGSHFTMETDHAPLKALQTSRNFTGRLARWALVIQSYDCNFMYKPRRLHSNVNALTCIVLLISKPYSKFLRLGKRWKRPHQCAYSDGSTNIFCELVCSQWAIRGTIHNTTNSEHIENHRNLGHMSC